MFFAGAGVSWFLDKMRFSTTVSTVAGFFYMLSPYSLQYLYRISDILLPWAALGWLMGLMFLATLKKGWKYVAIFALVVAVIGGTNGSSLIFAGIGPVMLLLYLWLVKKQLNAKEAMRIVLKLAILCSLVSIWWFVALEIEANFGLNILKYTETVQAVASTSLASEVMRGLGYWFYYGQNTVGPWAPSSVGYMEHIWLILISFAIPTLAIIAAVFIRFKNRGFFVILLGVGLVASVGTHPFGNPGIWGRFITWVMLYTTPGFALRSTDRAAPLVIMCLALFFATGVDITATKIKTSAISLKFSILNKPTTVFVVAGLLLILNNPAMLDNQLLSPQYSRPSNIPAYYYQAGSYLNKQPNDTRILVEPGTDTSVYRWGVTGDPILPGLTSRQTVERVQLPHGTNPSLDLVTAIDQPFQEETLNPATLAPLARLISAGDILLQSDLAYEDYDLPNPRQLWSQFTPTPKGLGSVVKFGKPVPNVPPKNEKLIYGEQSLAQNSNLPWPAPLTVFNVPNARPLIRTESTSNPIIVDGGGTGLVNSAAIGLLNSNASVLYSGAFTDNNKDKTLLQKLASTNADLVLTDTNRKESRRWDGTIQDVNGYTETASQTNNPQDYSNAPINLFPNSPNSQTITVLNGIQAVNASVYGNQVTYEPYQRPSQALDGNPDTAWSYSSFVYPPGQWWEVTLINPVTANYIDLSQVLTGSPIEKITNVSLNFHNGYSQSYQLDALSRTVGGQKLEFPPQTFSQLTITINATAPTGSATGTDAVGFSTVNIPGITLQEVVATPTDMLSTLGAASLTNRLSILLNRQTVGPFPPRGNPENTIARQVWLPTNRQFSITGLAALSQNAPDNVIDSVIGITPTNGNGYVANSSGRLPGFLMARAYSAFDNNTKTSWSPGSGYNQQIGSWVEIDTPKSVTFNKLNLSITADKYHSVPKTVTISTESGLRTLNLPSIVSKGPKNRAVTVVLNFPQITGRHIRLTIDSIQPFYGKDIPNQPFYTLPVGIAEVGIPGVTMPAAPKSLPKTCWNNLISINGVSVPIRLEGSVKNALNGGPIAFVACNSSQPAVSLFAGNNIVQTLPGSQTGIDINSIGLDSGPGGSANPILSPGQLQPPQSNNAVASLKVRSSSAVKFTAQLTSTGKPFWLILGQSQDKGWTLSIDGKPVKQSSTLIDGYANGWLISPPAGIHTYSVSFYFYPQTWLNYSYILFILALVLTILVAIFAKRLSKNDLEVLVDPITLELRGDLLKLKTKTTEHLRLKAIVSLILLTFFFNFMFMPWTYALSASIISMIGVVLLRSHRVFGFFSFMAMGCVAIYVSVAQIVYTAVAGDSWPSSYELANFLAWFAVISLVIFHLFEFYITRTQNIELNVDPADHRSSDTVN